MSDLIKLKPTLYVDTDDQCPIKYCGLPVNFEFTMKNVEMKSWMGAIHEMDYSKGELWRQFAPSGEFFLPGGERDPLVFQTITEIHRSITATLVPDSLVKFGKIGEGGLSSFGGEIKFRLHGVDERWDQNPHGKVWLAPANTVSRNEEIYVTLVLDENSINLLFMEIGARKDAVLRISLNFAAYQEEGAHNEGERRGLFCLEEDVQIPIIEANISLCPADVGPSNKISEKYNNIIINKLNNFQESIYEFKIRFNLLIAILIISCLLMIIK